MVFTRIELQLDRLLLMRGGLHGFAGGGLRVRETRLAADTMLSIDNGAARWRFSIIGLHSAAASPRAVVGEVEHVHSTLAIGNPKPR